MILIWQEILKKKHLNLTGLLIFFSYAPINLSFNFCFLNFILVRL